MINLSMNVGLFSYVMISSFPLLIDEKIINCIKIKFLNKYNNKFNLFYDSDCGFCHYSVRIIKRLDIFNRIIFCDGNSKVKKPKEFDTIADKTAILYSPKTDIIWTRHRAFGKILSIIPFGFLISWIFFIPFLSEFFGMIYDQIAKNRTKISSFFGLPACNIPINNNENNFQININKKSYIQIHSVRIFKIISPLLIVIMISSSIWSALDNHKLINLSSPSNKKTKKEEENYINLKDIHRYPRMIQKWTMFGDVGSSDEIIIVEATLSNGKKINPFTGKEPVLNSTDYNILMKNKSQLWRKYFERLYNKTRKLTYAKHNKNAKLTILKMKNDFTNWIINPKNTYFKSTIGDNKIEDIEIYRVTTSAPNINKSKNNKVRKTNFTILEKKMKFK